ncbi:hypothetical protein [Glutamicibacter halophytocola]|uniref:hypothetical protein n=1 Tax=Glutamicibacter halophytocola TaxID=1933880 RepID=UPI0015C54065|nr:hypothetical protein [Glutamicibacter halophytocola]NQD39987.1 hypothetical protein [Glutamicibacter halophytocola]
MSTEDEIQRLVNQQKEGERNRQLEKFREEREFWVAMQTAWDSYVSRCREIAVVLEREGVPTIPLYGLKVLKKSFLRPNGGFKLIEFGRGWSLHESEASRAILGVIGTDGQMYRELRECSSPNVIGNEYWKHMHPHHVPFDLMRERVRKHSYKTSAPTSTWDYKIIDGELVMSAEVSGWDHTYTETVTASVSATEFAAKQISKARG